MYFHPPRSLTPSCLNTSKLKKCMGVLDHRVSILIQLNFPCKLPDNKFEDMGCKKDIQERRGKLHHF